MARGEAGWTSALPVIGQLRGYRRDWLRGDLYGGVSACVVMIPSVIAYADLAGLSPASGLYAALSGVVGYALFASSKQVIAGPDAALTLLVASAVGPLSGGDPQRAATLAAAMAVLGGAFMLIAALLRVGAIADFLSKPILVGYMGGAALILVSTQLGKLFGLTIERRDFFPVLAELWGRLGRTHLPTLGLGIALLGLLAAMRRFAPRIPGALLVSAVAVAASAAFDLQAHGVRVVGDVPSGLPRFSLPDVSRADLLGLFPAAFGIALLTFPDGFLLARALAARHGYDVDPRQELRALAASNLAAGLFQGFSVGASQSRTTVNETSGGRTQAASLVAAGALLLFLLFLTPVLRWLPIAVLGAILVFAGIQLIEPREYVRLYRLSRRSCVVALLVTVGVLVVGVVPGILIGVMVSLVILLARLARPTDAVLQEVTGTGRFHDLGDAKATVTVPGLVAYRFYAPIFFANAQHFRERVRGLVAAGRGSVRWLLVDVQAVPEIDVTGAEMLVNLSEELASQGVALKFARANRPLRERIAAMDVCGKYRGLTNFPSVHEAIEAFRDETRHVTPASRQNG